MTLHTNLTQINSSLKEYNFFIYSFLLLTHHRIMAAFIYHNDYLACNTFGIKQASQIEKV
jgi:hypothetical protein